MRHKSRRHQEQTEPGIECDAHGLFAHVGQAGRVFGDCGWGKERAVYVYAMHSSQKLVAAARACWYLQCVCRGVIYILRANLNTTAETEQRSDLCFVCLESIIADIALSQNETQRDRDVSNGVKVQVTVLAPA